MPSRAVLLQLLPFQFVSFKLKGFEAIPDIPPVAFTLHAVGQDTFEDVVVPDGNTQPPKTPNVGTNGVR